MDSEQLERWVRATCLLTDERRWLVELYYHHNRWGYFNNLCINGSVGDPLAMESFVLHVSVPRNIMPFDVMIAMKDLLKENDVIVKKMVDLV